MKTKFLSFLLLAATACGAAGGDSGTDGGSSADPNGDATNGPGGGGSNTPSNPAPGPVAANLTLSKVEMRNVGRRGDILQVKVSGSDDKKATSAVHVRLTDESDADVNTFDKNWDGVAEAAERRAHFDTSTFGQAKFDGVVTLQGVYTPSSRVKKAHVWLEDESGGHSSELVANLMEQTVKGETEACDLAQVTDRCQASMSCGGSPPGCLPGVAPQVTKSVYVGGLYPRMMFGGTEPDQDFASVRVEYLDNSEASLNALITGDRNDPNDPNRSYEREHTYSATDRADGPLFTLSTEPIDTFVADVPKLRVTPKDAMDHAGDPFIVSRGALTVRGSAQACDYQGFDTCAGGFTCWPRLANGNNTCASVIAVRTQRCAAIRGMDPKKGIKTAFGVVQGASLWDPPAGCVSNDTIGRPDAAVALHLSEMAANLTITTAVDETDFDTALYLIPGACAATTPANAACNDDTTGVSSTLSLTNVAAGDYTIVVESVHPQGGHFGLSVDVK